MPAPRPRAPAGLDELLMYKLSRLLSVGGGMVIRLCEGRFGITRREWRVLARLAQEQELLSSELAERIQLDRARTSRAVTSLVAKKLVRRQAGTSDRRQARLALTERGRTLHGELFPLVCEINRQLLSPLSAQDAARLDAMLSTLQAQAEDMVNAAELPKADRRRGARARTAMG
jgi:DNA-binding MarR family transcriptional regulator